MADALLVQGGRTLAAVLAVGAVAAVAAVVDLRTPTVSGLARIALPSGALAGLGWSIATLRGERVDGALSALGMRPGLALWAPGVVLASALCVGAPPRSDVSDADRGATLEVHPEHLTARIGEHTLDLRWDDPAGAPRLPAPTGTTRPTGTPEPTGKPIWILLAAGLAFALTRGPTPPGVLRTVTAAAAVSALGFALGG